MVMLPVFQTAIRELSMMQTKWSTILNQLLSNPSLQSNILSGIALINGTTIIQHKLGRTLTGWRIIRINGACEIYDQQSSNKNSDQTLVLVSNAAVQVSLEVF